MKLCAWLLWALAPAAAAQTPAPATGSLTSDGLNIVMCGTSGPLAFAGLEFFASLLARQASIMDDTLSYHTPVEVAEIAKAAGVKALILYHLTQAGLPFFTPDGFTKGMDAVGFRDWRLAKDGMTIDLPAGSTEIRYR